MAIPGFPSNNYDWSGGEVGAALAGLIVRDVNGVPRAGILPSRPDLVQGRADWFYDVNPFVAVRVAERRILIGPSPVLEPVATSPAPAANARIDVVYSRPADADGGEAIEAVFVAQGLPSAVPAKPALPEGAVELASFRVSAGNANTSQATATQSFLTTVTAGGVVPFRSTAEMNAFAGVPGQYAQQGGNLYLRTSSGWQLQVGDSGWKTATLKTGFTGALRFRFKNGLVTASGAITNATLDDEYKEICVLPSGIPAPDYTADFTYVAGVENGRTTNFRVTSTGSVQARRNATSSASVPVEAIRY